MRVVHERLMRALAHRAGLRAFRLFSRPLDTASAVPSPARIDVRPLPDREVLSLCRDPELDLAEGRAREAYDRGDVCVGAFEAERLVAYCWLAFSPLPHLDGVWVAFDARAVWTYKSFVRPSHRGRRIAPALYRFGDSLCAERGRRFSIVCVETHNRPSVAAARRSGYRPAGYAGYLRGAADLRTWYSLAAKRMALHYYLPDQMRMPLPKAT